MRSHLLAIALALALVGVGARALVAQSPSVLPPASPVIDPAPVLCPPDKGHEDHEEHEEEHGALYLGADYLLLKPRRRPMDFALVGPATVFGPQGDIRSLSLDTSSGFRAGGGYRLPGEGWDVSGFYTYFQSNTSDTAARPPGGVLYPTLTHPNLVELADRSAANASLDYHVFDLELGRRFHHGESLAGRVFAGPRFARIRQSVNAFYDGEDAVRDQVRSRVDFDGGGLRAGGEGVWKLWRGVGLYGRGGVSLLAGNFRSRLTETAADGAVTLVNVTDRFHKIVPVMELGMGVSWQVRSWRLTAGYELVQWFGVVDGIDFADDASAGKFMRRTGDLGLDGLVVRMEWAF